MDSIVMALGIASIMLCIGMFLRSKISFLKKMLVPVSVIAGVLGFIFMNLITHKTSLSVTVTDYSGIVDVLFTISFISIGLGSNSKSNKKTNASINGKKESTGTIKGALAMGIIWCVLYTLTAIIGVLIVSIVGKAVNMDSMYGILIPFEFCQGPGQASTYGRIFEQLYGYQNAEMVALTFAIVGFLVAFLIGVPLAKYGLKKGLAKSKSKIGVSVERGYYKKEEQRESIGKITTHSGNIETLTIHFAVMGVTYLIALVLAKTVSYIPGIGDSFGAMVFLWGMIAAYLVKYIMRKLKIDYLINIQLQGRITGWASDYLVVCAFMAIAIGTIGNWIVPILIVSAACGVITFFVCLYFGARIGSDHDFERVLGLFGTCTGTTPSGVALLRMIDPKLQTTTATELGMMNMIMIFSTPTMIIITLAGLNTISLPMAIGGLLLCIILYLVLLKVFKLWRKPTFSLGKGIVLQGEKDDYESINGFVKGFIREEYSDTAGLVK